MEYKSYNTSALIVTAPIVVQRLVKIGAYQEINMMQSIKAPSGNLLILILAVLVLSGCQSLNAFNPAGLYIHNEGRAKLSQEARDSFDTYRKNSLSVFGQMQSNLDISNKFWTDSTNIAKNLQTDIFNQGIPLFTWEQLLSPYANESIYKTLVSNVKKQNDASLSSLRDAVAKLGISKEDLKSRNKIIESLENKVKEQKTENEKYEKNIQDFRKVIINLSDNSKETSTDDLIKSILATQKLEWDPSKGPGFKTALISLALDLAEVERDRTSTKIAFLQKVISNGKKQQSIVSEADEILKATADDYKDFPGNLKNSFTEKQRISNTIVKVLEQYHAAASVDARLEQFSNIQTILEVIGNIAVVESIYIPELRELEQELASLEHSRSIQVSRINARAREEIISRGLESLAIYHAGGIRPEEIAHFIYAASLVAAVAF